MNTAPAVPPDPESAPERGPRPATATVAGVVQLLTVLLAVALVAVAWIGYSSHEQLIDRAVELVPAADPDAVATERGNNLFGAVALTVLLGLIVLWFGATLWPTWRGSNIARILVTGTRSRGGTSTRSGSPRTSRRPLTRWSGPVSRRTAPA